MSFDFAEADRRRPDPNPPNAIPNANSSLGNERGSAADCPRSAARQVTRIAAETARLPLVHTSGKDPHKRYGSMLVFRSHPKRVDKSSSSALANPVRINQ